MSHYVRIGDTTATAGYDARWPIRAYHAAYSLARGPALRSHLAALLRCIISRSIVEDTLCAMENDRIVLATAAEHLTRGERIALLAQDGGVFVPQITFTLSDKGIRFIAEHQQNAPLGTCTCVWCAELAEVRAWADRQTPEQISAAWNAVAAQIT
jgi:hypothetical protein